MTIVAMKNGAVIMQDGEVGTGSGCCCDGQCPCIRPCCDMVYTIPGTAFQETIPWNDAGWSNCCHLINTLCPYVSGAYFVVGRVCLACSQVNQAVNCMTDCTITIEWQNNNGSWSQTPPPLYPGYQSCLDGFSVEFACSEGQPTSGEPCNPLP